MYISGAIDRIMYVPSPPVIAVAIVVPVNQFLAYTIAPMISSSVLLSIAIFDMLPLAGVSVNKVVFWNYALVQLPVSPS